MEFRAYVAVPGVDVESDDAERLLDVLADRHGGLGPVLSGHGDGLQVIVSTDTDDEATAARDLYAAVMDGLQHAGLAHRYASRLELELVAELAGAH
jgi:hypothetical protein